MTVPNLRPTRAIVPLEPPAADDVGAHLRRVTAETERALQHDDIAGMDDFVTLLDQVRRTVAPADWRTLIAEIVAPHPIRARLHEEPFTCRAFQKPRGYPGDAALIDLVYRDRPFAEPLTALGARLHQWAEYQAGCLSVQDRRRILAALIDRVATERPNPRILSLACGHLREAQRSEAVLGRGVEELVAVDQDSESLAVVEREQRQFNVTPVQLSVRRFLINPTTRGTFDLAYAAGLYDYLADGVATSLTRALFGALRPGGLLLVGNFAPELRDIGYMEAIMDWNLIYRDEAAMARLASGVPAERIAETTVTRDSLGNVVYLSIRKA